MSSVLPKAIIQNWDSSPSTDHATADCHIRKRVRPDARVCIGPAEGHYTKLGQLTLNRPCHGRLPHPQAGKARRPCLHRSCRRPLYKTLDPERGRGTDDPTSEEREKADACRFHRIHALTPPRQTRRERPHIRKREKPDARNSVLPRRLYKTLDPEQGRGAGDRHVLGG